MRKKLSAAMLMMLLAVHANGAKIIKVLPQYLDHDGRASLSPSLFDRDAYQAVLRDTPSRRSALRFHVQWKGREKGTLLMRVDMRGVKEKKPTTATFDMPVQNRRFFSTWTDLKISGAPYRDFGELLSWRVTLWQGDKLLSEQRSFLQ